MENTQNRRPKFTCFFCNKTIQNETEMGHTSMCGKVLVSCQNNCGAYIARENLKKHSKECINRTTRSTPKTSVPQERYVPETATSPYNTLSRNGVTKNDNQQEIYKLSRKLAELETRLYQYSRTQTQPQVSVQSFESLKTSQLQFNLDVEKLKYQNQIAFDWRSKTDTLLSQIRQSVAGIENTKRDVDMNLTGIQSRIMVLEKMQDQINYVKDSFLREQAYNRQVDMNFNENMEEFRKQVTQENTKMLAILADLKDSVSSIQLDLNDTQSILKDQGIKFTNIIYDLRGASQSAAEANNKAQQLEKEYNVIKNKIEQMKLDMEILEGLSSSSDIRNTPGRLLWKITEVDTKMVQAKQSDSVLKSPIFLTHEYGYRIRVLMYLNGLKKWKDRYALLCFHVLKGEYDMVLKWPCQIEGTLTLRDLEDLDKAKPFTKTLTAKRQSGNEECEEPQESSSCYIFIPHTTLLKSNYMKNDTIFIDIKIRQDVKLETSL